MPLKADQIRQFLPHRWPFIFLDQVLELEPGQRGLGLKNVTISEPFFQGHFPEESIMPGVLMLEALAQLTAVVYTTGSLPPEVLAGGGQVALAGFDPAGRVGYLVGIKQVKFMRPVTPGDQLLLEARIGGRLGLLSQVAVAARVGKEAVLSGHLVVSERPGAEEEADGD